MTFFIIFYELCFAALISTTLPIYDVEINYSWLI